MKPPRTSLTRRLSCLAIALALLLAAGLVPLPATTPAAQAATDSKGTEFWLTFPENLASAPELSLFITGQTATTGTVSIPVLSFSSNFSVTPGAVTTVSIPASATLTSSDVVESKGIRVVAGAEVTVYGLNRFQATTDAYLGLPTDILGTEYISLGYKNVGIVNGTEFALVATQDGTQVTITPAVTTGIRSAGVPYTISLNTGQTYQLKNTGSAPNDLSRSVISSNKPVAVFGGHQCANIPNVNTLACDHIVEQLPPTTTWGTSFATMPLATRQNGDTFRFVASQNGTTVKVNGSTVATLNRAELHEQLIVGPAFVTADKPILVAQYSNGSTFDGVTSDPFMMLIPPYEQFLAQYTVTTPATGFSQNFINLVVPNAAVGAVTLDGTAIPASQFVAIGSSGFSGTQRAVALGAHNLAGPLPFGTFMYGFASFDSYGYPGGMSLSEVARVTSVALAPKTATNPVNTQHCVTATVRDQSNAPLPDIRVDFAVTGVNPTAGFASSNTSGQAQFCYTGASAGSDSIKASVGTLSDTASKTWQSVAPPAQTITITFNDASGRDRQLGGEYPAGIVNWGTNSWWLASPTGKFSTKSLSLNGNKVPALTESTFAFVTPRRLLSLEAFNSGPAPAIVTLRCDGALLKQATLAAGELATITTGWAVPCGTVSLGADNGWDTNFDNLVVDNTPLPATQQLLTLNTLSGQNRALNGVNTPAPNDLVNWGSGKWFLSGPDGAFNTRSVSLANGLTQGTIGFIAPQRLVSLQAHNGGGATTTLTLSCGAQTRSATLVPGQTLTILTGWTAPCAEVGVTSTNGWDTNLDNLLLDTASAP